MATEVVEDLDRLIKTEVGVDIDDFIKRKLDSCFLHPRLEYSNVIISKLLEFIDKVNTNLISVKHQKTLKSCFQLITSLGLLPCLLPGLGIPIEKRCEHGSKLTPISIDDITKYKHLKTVTDFFIKAYEVPILKNIIMTYHLSDYLAALIQLSFAPLKKPGTYGDFIMTEEFYNVVSADKKRYHAVYDHLVVNSFQPSLMKELLVLQGSKSPAPPKFAINALSKELSRRLLAPGGLLSLMRCFIESYKLDIGVEWKQIEMLCKITSTVQGQLSEDEYLQNICCQLKEVMSSNNIHYLTVSSACLQSLNQKFKDNTHVEELLNGVFEPFTENYLSVTAHLPGTILFSNSELEKRVNFLHNTFMTSKLCLHPKYLVKNIVFLHHLRTQLRNNEEIFKKSSDLILKCLESLDKSELNRELDRLLFDFQKSELKIEFLKTNSLINVKSSAENFRTTPLESVASILNLLSNCKDALMLQNIFVYSLDKLIVLTNEKAKNSNKDLLLVEEDVEFFDNFEQHYAAILKLLSELCSMESVMQSIKDNPEVLFEFIKAILANAEHGIEEPVSISLILLNTILAEMKVTEIDKWRSDLLKQLEKISGKNSPPIKLLVNEAKTILQKGNSKSFKKKSRFESAIDDLMDNLLPVKAHGIIELTKLIKSKDVETISKKHYVFCILQEHLKDEDSYIYLASINGLAALGNHCTEDVLQVLCKEFLDTSSGDIEVRDSLEKKAQLRMKVGDVIVKVTAALGEMAVVHKPLLLNTVLCACRDPDDLVRASALSNLAEIARVINYKVGNIISEILLCIWSVIDSDKSPECRRAAVMVISSLLKGTDKSALIQFKDVLLPIYRTLKTLYKDENEDEKVRLHAQMSLEQLNELVVEFLTPSVDMKKVFVID